MNKIILSIAMASSILVAGYAMADRFDVTCNTLGDVGECLNVSICKEQVQAACVPVVNSIRPDICVGAGERNCGYFKEFCHWDVATQCVPLRR